MHRGEGVTTPSIAPLTHQEIVRQVIKNDLAKYSKLVKAAGIQPQ